MNPECTVSLYYERNKSEKDSYCMVSLIRGITEKTNS